MQKSPSLNELRERYYLAQRTERERRAREGERFDWSKNARPSQVIPPGPWVYWLTLAGRGFGKTRTGAETCRRWVKDYPFVNLIGATLDDARDIMIEGESGILAVCPRDERPKYLSLKRQLQWPNGAKSLIFTADEDIAACKRQLRPEDAVTVAVTTADQAGRALSEAGAGTLTVVGHDEY